MKRKLNENDVPEAVGDTNEKSSAESKPTFSSLGLDARLLQAVNREKFSAPTPVQTKAIPLALNGKDVLARAQTGSGKTLAYLLPIVNSILQRKASTKSRKYTSALILVPTKELATQVCSAVKTFTTFCGSIVRCENLTTKEDVAVTTARLAEGPDAVVATPSRASLWLNNGGLRLDELKWVVIDEADLVLSYGYEDDLNSLAEAIPSAGVQTIMMSATLSTSTTALSNLFCKTGGPTILDLSASEAAEKQQLSQYVIRTAEEDKFLLIYAIFKLQLIKGKVIVFVADIDRCYRVKLFLEQFGIRSCVLNSELPVNSRQHAVEEFNKGVYDILIAADETEVVGEQEQARKKRKVTEHEDGANDEAGGDDQADEAQSTPLPFEYDDDGDGDGEAQEDQSIKKSKDRPARRKQGDREFGISRGIDFRHVSCVLNFDLPTTAKSYTHQTGRTARAGQTGMALSFSVPKELYRKHKSTSIPQCKNDEEVLAKIKKREEDKGRKVEEWQFDMHKLEGLRYRFGDALRNVTRIAIREARTRELKRELINSAKLQRHFEENPEELRHLRHDGEGSGGRTVRTMPHLKHVPDYLLPSGGKRAVQGEVGFVSLRGDKERREKRRGLSGRDKMRGRMQSKRWKGKGVDPLKSLNVRGKMKK